MNDEMKYKKNENDIFWQNIGWRWYMKKKNWKID